MVDEVTPLNGPGAADSSYPVIGDSVEGLKRYLIREGRLENEEAFARVRDDAVLILRDCVRFNAPDAHRTGICVGYVQSGKTLSMTVVSAMARDNGCRIVIMLAGVTNILLKQSVDRFRNDLREAEGKPNSWRFFNSADGFGAPQIRALQQAVLDWKDPIFKDDQQTLFFVVLKHHSHLDDLTELLKAAPLKGVPAIVIDDEADQAGLNTNPEEGIEDASTIYRRIARMRNALPHHTYLQYTATPQAPLLIALDDILSPEFAELVRPGTSYTGGQTFFGLHKTKGLVHAIPEVDLFKPGAPPEEVPRSLIDALRVFFVGCAIAATRGKPKLRSMLVHPSQRNADHSRYLNWISEAIKRWTTALRSDETDRQDALKEFRPAYDELAPTIKEIDGVEALPTFDGLRNQLLIALTRVSLTEVNSHEGTEIDWRNASDHILVGGEKLNRGYTVEGLTVTYMPRDAGGWNADTIQQRARFFGYKSSYLSLCRLYLHPEVIEAFQSYVRHEEDIRKQLATHRGKPLRVWRRAFFLDAKMRPTRQNVLLDPYYKVSQKKGWFVQRFPHEADLARNRNVMAPFEKLTYESGIFSHHLSTETSLEDLYRKLLIDFDVRKSDVPNWYAQLVMIDGILAADPKAKACVIRMRADATREKRERSLSKGEVQLFQGAGSTKKTTGDKSLFDQSLVTIQLHWLDVTDGPRDVRAIAVHVPDALREDVGVQPKRG